MNGVFSLRVAWNYKGDDYDVPRGFERGDDENLNTFRAGPLVFMWGKEFGYE